MVKRQFYGTTLSAFSFLSFIFKNIFIILLLNPPVLVLFVRSQEYMPTCIESDTSGTLEGVYDSNRWDSFLSVLLRDIATFAVVCVEPVER